MDVVVVTREYERQMTARGYSPGTIRSYLWNLGRFRKYLSARGISDLRSVTVQVIEQYQHEVMCEPIAPESKALKLRAVKRLFEYLVETDRLLLNPTEAVVEISRRGRKIGPVLSEPEMQRLLRTPDLSRPTGLRDRAVMEVLYSTAVRVGELAALEITDADLRERVLHVRKGKGGKERTVPLGKTAAGYVARYMEEERPGHVCRAGETRLFVTRHGLPLTTGTVQGFIRKHALKAGIRRPVSPHMFRRSCATHMLSRGADVRYIQQLLGHTRLGTTQSYTRVRPTEIKDTHERTHPRIRDGQEE